MHIEHDKNERGYPNTQAEDVHKRSDFVAPKDAERYEEKRAEHGCLVLLGLMTIPRYTYRIKPKKFPALIPQNKGLKKRIVLK
jgi:hypothetical protein